MTTIFDAPGFNPPNPFTPVLDDSLATADGDAPSPDTTAAKLVTMVCDAEKTSEALWQLWDALFIHASTSTDHAPHIALVEALRSHAPTKPRVSGGSTDTSPDPPELHWPTLPSFSSQWTDAHDALEAWRDWDGVRRGAGSKASDDPRANGREPSVVYRRFSTFSARLLGTGTATGGFDQIDPVWVFFGAIEGLERKKPNKKGGKTLHRLPPREVWLHDVEVAAIWVRDAAGTLWKTDMDALHKSWTALYNETDLWEQREGLTRGRWCFWEERLRELVGDGDLSERAKEVVAQAADVVRGLLGEERSA